MRAVVFGALLIGAWSCSTERDYITEAPGAEAGASAAGSPADSVAGEGSGGATAGNTSVPLGGQDVGGEAGAPTGTAGATGDCEAGETTPCYESLDGEAYEGTPAAEQTTCRLGERTCESDGTWSACSGAIGPKPADTCTAGDDGNCNGVPNEGCACTDGAERPCTATPETCPAGEQTCSDNAWGACEGEVKCAVGSICGDDEVTCKLVDGQKCSSTADCATSACSTFFADADKDSYRDNGTPAKFCGATKTGYVSLTNNKGDDCDEKSAAVNPGASEDCDGIDNDCDGKIDYADNPALTLSGSQKQIATGRESATAAVGSSYAVAYVFDKTYLQILSQANSAAPKAEIDPNQNLSLAVASDGSNGAGIFYYRDTSGSNGELWFRRATANGLTASAAIKVASARRANGASASWMTGSKWLYAASGGANGGAAWSYAIGFDGMNPGSELTPEGSSGHAVATSGSTFGLLYSVGKNLEYSARNSAFVQGNHTTQSFAGDIYGTAITARPDGGFAVVFSLPNGLMTETYVEEISANGTVVCGPTQVSNGIESLIATKRGFLAVGASGGTLFAQEILSGCSVGQSFPSIGTNATGNVSIAKSSLGYAIVWDNGTNVYSRTFGANLCD